MILDTDPVIQITADGKLPENADPKVVDKAIDTMNGVPSGITVHRNDEGGLLYIYASIIPNCFILKETFPEIASYFTEAQMGFNSCYEEEKSKL